VHVTGVQTCALPIWDSSAITLGTGNTRIEVYEKGGKHLLSLTPTTDSVPGIGTIQVMDPRYLTKNGIGLKSRFKDIERNYEIRKIGRASCRERVAST